MNNDNRYRLGDIYWFCFVQNWAGKDMKYPEYMPYFEYHATMYPKFFGGRLVAHMLQLQRRLTANEMDSMLLNMILEYNPQIRPAMTELVIHCRVGDVIEQSIHTVDEHLSAPLMADNYPVISQRIYVQPYSYYEGILRQNISIHSVTLIAGGVSSCGSKSYEYIQKLTAWIESKNLPVSSRVGEDPDRDFVYMCRATHFIPGGGGFTNLICHMRQLLDNE